MSKIVWTDWKTNVEMLEMLEEKRQIVETVACEKEKEVDWSHTEREYAEGSYGGKNGGEESTG